MSAFIRIRTFQAIRPLGLLLLLAMLAQCTFKKNQPEHPYPNDGRVHRSFFEFTDKNGKVHLKTFLAGWSPEVTAGAYSSAIFAHYNSAGHANIVFETNLSETELVGKMVTASFQKDGEDCLERDDKVAIACRARWPSVITIPLKRFYYEQQKDSRGRKTDIYVENSQRSHWQAQPFFNLKLPELKIHDWAMDLLWHGHKVHGLEDIKWDREKGYLAFTIEASDAVMGSRLQGKFRFNFLEFQHNPKFPITPFRHANSRYINILHVIGKEIEGDPKNPILYAAHWDTSKKHTIWLHGFPKEYESIGRDVIEHWNDAFAKVGHGRPFEAKISEREHAFDLRYPTITWVADQRSAYGAPLGVGMALADVRNGDIRWGAVTIWGGMLESIINDYSPAEAASAAAEAFTHGAEERPVVQLALMEPDSTMPSRKGAFPEGLTGASSVEAIKNNLLAQMVELHGRKGGVDTKANANAEALVRDLSPIATQLAEGYVALQNRGNVFANRLAATPSPFRADAIQDLIGMPRLNQSLNRLPISNTRKLEELTKNRAEPSKRDLIQLLQSSALGSQSQASAFDTDRRFYQVAAQYAQGLSDPKIDKSQAVRAMIKDILLHEVGHMLGLGHNFKENILPDPGTLPDKSAEIGLYGPYERAQLEKKATQNFTNYTTVMGYKHPVTDIQSSYESLTPGPGDILSLEYLYNQRYPIYPEDGKGQGNFEFVKLPKDGWILEKQALKRGDEMKIYKPAYFPACNDFAASIGDDPECARFDRGYNATTIVRNYFDTYRSNLISSLNAYTDAVKGQAVWKSEFKLWMDSLNTFGRVRTFYDHMRQLYDQDLRKLADSGSEDGLRNLLQFGETCTRMSKGETSIENKTLEALFRANPKLLDLCIASATIVTELDQLLQVSGKDYSVIDYFRRYATSSMFGGEVSGWSQNILGSWKELARAPLKIPALMTLTSPYAYNGSGGWAYPISRFARQDGGYHLSTLFPREYTSAVASATEMNLNLGNTRLEESPIIGRTVLAMGYFLNMTFRSNDVLRFGSQYMENIRSQTDFRYSHAIVEVIKEDEQGRPIARKFTGTIYNMYQRGPETIPELYLYTKGQVIVRPPPGSLLLPVTPIRWSDRKSGYYYAIKLDYSDEFFDRLKTNSVRQMFSSATQNVLKLCLDGENKNGLRYHFSREVSEKQFPGFAFPETITKTDSKDLFLFDVEKKFDEYYNNEGNFFLIKPQRHYCRDALNGQALLVMAASALNGYYFPALTDFLEQGAAW